MEDLEALLDSLDSRGIREKALADALGKQLHAIAAAIRRAQAAGEKGERAGARRRCDIECAEAQHLVLCGGGPAPPRLHWCY